MKIVKANRFDAKIITELAIRSKNYWNYGIEQIEEWKDKLTITPKFIDQNQVYKLIIDHKLVGFYAYLPENKKEIKLDSLFIEPEDIGKGYGKILMSDFLQRIRKTTFEKVILHADPNAEKFYQQIGFKVTGKLKSSIKNRYLPIMEMRIK